MGSTSAADEVMLKVAVNAAGAGHDLGGFEVVMDGDDGINAEFDVSDYRTVFKIMGARKR